VYSVFQKPIVGNGCFPQGLKPAFFLALDGMAKAMPLQRTIFETRSKQQRSAQVGGFVLPKLVFQQPFSSREERITLSQPALP
jgi:hypothetical protein